MLEQDGPPDEFTGAAASACAVAVQGLRDREVQAARDSVVAVLGAVVAGDAVEDGDERAADADLVATATRTAANTLATVEAPDDRAAAWAELSASLTSTADVAQARAEALRDGDPDAIAGAFAPGVGPSDPGVVSDAVTSLGLDRRDCAAVG